MNFLAHAHIATLAKSDLLGNMVADFIKGDPYKDYPVHLADGVMLHRRIDYLVDHIDEVKQARRLFSPVYRRIAPITLDIVWDHFLAKEWSFFSPNQSLVAFTQQIKETLEQSHSVVPEGFYQLNHYLWKEEWLINYADLDFIQQVLTRMAKRRTKLHLLEGSFDDIKTQYAALKQQFYRFYPALLTQLPIILQHTTTYYDQKPILAFIFCQEGNACSRKWPCCAALADESAHVTANPISKSTQFL